MRLLPNCATALLVAATIALLPEPGTAQDRFELEPEYVYGKNRRPRLGYRKPEVFDPLSDRLYRSGFKDYPPTAIPDELKEVDRDDTGEGHGPHPRPAPTAGSGPSRAPHARTSRRGWRSRSCRPSPRSTAGSVDIAWVNTVTRFGPVAPGGPSALDQQGVCDIVLGLTVTNDDHHMEPHQMAFTRRS